MSNINIDLLRREECQPLTTAQMDDIKSQFHPSSTANVNITPYHIYDEDGVEQTVGEVRKTIDGVKKKKPVYKKTCELTSTVTVGSSWSNLLSTSQYGLGDIDTVIYGGAVRSSTQGLVANLAFNAKDKSSGYIKASSNEGGGWDFPSGSLIILKYTKDTDEWEEV